MSDSEIELHPVVRPSVRVGRLVHGFDDPEHKAKVREIMREVQEMEEAFARRMEREKNSLVVRLHNLCDEWSKSKCSGEYGIAMRQCAAVLYSIIQEASNE
jgi:hypothetical protein